MALRVGTDRLARAAEGVLRRNDRGGWTKASPHLYPHQWSWDSAFIAIGWAHVDHHRAMTELQGLFEAQWATGMVPHIVYAEDDDGLYSPDAGAWDAQGVSDAAAGTPRRTSGICQPPVHAIAAAEVVRRALEAGDREGAGAFAEALVPKIFAWHRYLLTERDPEGTGLVTIHHPWESGTDNSPRWDFVVGDVLVGDMPAVTRYDLRHVTDPTQRPSDHEYEVYLWLLDRLKAVRYDDAAIRESHPFRVKDVLFSALLIAANQALIELADMTDVAVDVKTLEGWIRSGRRGVAARWDDDLRLCLDLDERSSMALRARTFAGLSPIIAGAVRTSRWPSTRSKR